MSLLVVEKFNAIQGEGDRAGFPSVFIRLMGCNLTCAGFNCKEISPVDGSEIIGCDSIRAVNKQHFGHLCENKTGFELVEEVQTLMKETLGIDNPYAELPDIVITGGEPMLHHKNDDLIFVVQYFTSRGHRVFVETNGTIKIDFNEFPVWKEVSFTISVKMSNSGEPEKIRWKSGVVNDYIQNTVGTTFKFVMDKDLSAAEEVISFLKMVPTFAPVYIMPMGGTRAELELCGRHVYEYAMKHGFRYSDRLHIRTYDSEPGR